MVTATDCFTGIGKSGSSVSLPVLRLHYLKYCFRKMTFTIFDSGHCTSSAKMRLYSLRNQSSKKILRMKVASNPTMQYFLNTSISETVFLKQRIYTERPSCNRSLGDYRNAISKNTTSK